MSRLLLFLSLSLGCATTDDADEPGRTSGDVSTGGVASSSSSEGVGSSSVDASAGGSTSAEVDSIPFVGTWSRTFSVGTAEQHATYTVTDDSIRYTLAGAIGNADYVMQRDAFVADERRFVGHTDDGLYYVVFVRDVSEEAITLYKAEVVSVGEGLGYEEPPEDTQENHGWNVYSRE